MTNLSYPPKGITYFYNGRGTAEQSTKEGKYALNRTRLSCRRLVANQVRLALFVLVYNLGNFLRRLALPEAVKDWSLRSLQVRLIKLGGRLVRHARRLVFHLPKVAVSRDVFQEVLDRIGRLGPTAGLRVSLYQLGEGKVAQREVCGSDSPHGAITRWEWCSCGMNSPCATGSMASRACRVIDGGDGCSYTRPVQVGAFLGAANLIGEFQVNGGCNAWQTLFQPIPATCW